MHLHLPTRKNKNAYKNFKKGSKTKNHAQIKKPTLALLKAKMKTQKSPDFLQIINQRQKKMKLYKRCEQTGKQKETAQLVHEHHKFPRLLRPNARNANSMICTLSPRNDSHAPFATVNEIETDKPSYAKEQTRFSWSYRQ